jgi:hypothetical protein
MSLLSKELHDWIRRQKIKYMHRQAGRIVPNKDTDLYFGWRIQRDDPRQNHESIHPGRKMHE